MNDELQTLVEFVEGRIDAKEFEKLLYQNPRIEQVLADDPTLPPNTYVGRCVYLFLIEQDFDDPGGVLNAQSALEEFLRRKGQAFKPTRKYKEFYDLLLEAQPSWLLVDTGYLKKNILPAAGDQHGPGLRDWLRGRLLELFRYVEKPPRWIQNPAWPINEHLFFLANFGLP